MHWLVLVGLASLLPVWRGGGHTRHDGVNFWAMARDMAKGVSHLPYDEAIRRASDAWANQNPNPPPGLF